MFNGLGMNLGNLWRISNAVSRSITAENKTGEKGKGGMATKGYFDHCRDGELGQKWKVDPCVELPPHEEFTIASINGSGAIQHIWMPPHPQFFRAFLLRMYWDGEENPSVCCPMGDFFLNGWCERVNVTSLPVCVNPAGAFNCYWEMPFRKSAKITVENLTDKPELFFYAIDYVLTDVPDDAAYFHAKWNRTNPVKYKDDYVIVDGIQGKGQYVGTYLAWQVNNNGWWGEGEIKFFMDGDTEFPTICGTGTEDYFGGAWNFEFPAGQYGVFSTPYTGLHQVIKPDGLYRANMRFGMYRFHITDPIRFEKNLKVTIQDLGWRANTKFHAQQDDIASVAFWYQVEPHADHPVTYDWNTLEVI